MASIRGNIKQSDINYSKFLGLYEAADGDTQMKNGVSPAMNNFQVTESFHLKTRPGIVPYRVEGGATFGRPCHAYYSDERCELAVFDSSVYVRFTTVGVWVNLGSVVLDRRGLISINTYPQFYSFEDRYYLFTGVHFYWWKPGEAAFTEVSGYVPLIVTGASPSGGGTTLERINMLTNKRRVQYSADGTSKKFVLPETIEKQSGETLILSVTLDGAAVTWAEVSGDTANTYAAELGSAPAQGVNNVEITYQNPRENNRPTIEKCVYAEKFNGATDSRLFVYNGRTGNIVYYSEPTLDGETTGAYFPLLNEIKVGDSSSPVTGLQRHYGRMMAFKPDSCYAIAYDTITLADGTITAGFYVRTMHRTLGSDLMGQVCVVQNFPRTFCNGSLYDWKQTASYYQDERYARLVSEPVQFSLRERYSKKLLYDDDIHHRFYCFLNDSDGTVLVNAYDQGVWFKYTGFHGVVSAGMHDGELILAMHAEGVTAMRVSGLYKLSEAHAHDYIPIIDNAAEGQPIIGYERCPIVCTWESGHMDFGKSNTRKYSSYIWVTLRPGRQVRARISARSDRRPSYAEKQADNGITGLFDETDFSDFTFETYEVPRVRRLKIKVKKFVYYKLLIRCENGESVTVPSVPSSTDGAVTVLSVDQRVRFTSDAK